MKTIEKSQASINFRRVSEVSIVYRNLVKPGERPQITCSKDAYEIFRDSWDATMEYSESFRILLLNRANKALGITTVSTGSLSGTIVDVRIIMQYALKGNAHSLILAHNHPSGNKNPSENDIKITQKIKEAGVLLDIPVLDHLILTPDDIYYSFADEGLL